MHELRYHRLIIVGPPQAGKGTWSRVIKEVLERELLLQQLARTVGVRAIADVDTADAAGFNGSLRRGLAGACADGAEVRAEDVALRVFSTGDLLREQISAQTELGRQVQAYVDQGKLVPDELVNEIVTGKLEELGYERFLMDGYPRTMDQGRVLLDAIHRRDTSVHLGEAGPKSPLIRYHEVDLLINVDCADSVIFDRIVGRRTCPTCGRIYNVRIPESKPTHDEVCDDDGTPLVRREDDREETVAKRLRIYKEHFRGIDNLVQRRNIPVVRLPGDGVAQELPEQHRDKSVVWTMAYYLCRMLNFDAALAEAMSAQVESKLASKH